MGDETEGQDHDVQQYTHDGAVDYAEMAGLGQTHYDQTAEHEGGEAHVSHTPFTYMATIDTQHADGSYSQEAINTDPNAIVEYRDTEWGADHSVSEHTVFAGGSTDDTHSAHGTVDEEGYAWHSGEHVSMDPRADHSALTAGEDDELEGL